MPRIGKTVCVPKEDIPVLESMRLSLDDDLSLPANIILCLMDDPSVQNAAKALAVTEPTISKWRDRYLQDGIDGLHPRKRSNHSTSPAEGKVRAFLEKADPNTTWTAKELAEELQLSPRQVRNVLKKLGLPSERKHSWTWTTVDFINDPGPYLIGLYLAYDTQVAILCSFQGRSLDGQSALGKVDVLNSALKDRFAASVTDLSLVDTLVTATEFLDNTVHAVAPSPNRFIEGFMEEWRDASDVTLRVYTCSDAPLPYRGTRLKNVFFEHFRDRAEWEDNIRGKLWPKNTTQFYEATTKMNAIDSYLQSCSQKSTPYMWHMCYSEPKLVKHQQPESLPVCGGEGGTIEEALESFLSGNEPKPGYQECVLTLSTRNEDGKVVYQAMNAELPSTASFDLSTQESFENSINALDACATVIGNTVDKGTREFYLDKVKKNQ